MHNYYTYLYNKAVYDVLVETKGADQAILFARSATVGGQRFPVHWGGDCSSNYPSMAESLRAGLSFGMSGFGYWSHDIAGFEDRASGPVQALDAVRPAELPLPLPRLHRLQGAVAVR